MFWCSDSPFPREAYGGLRDRVLTVLEFATLGAYAEDARGGAPDPGQPLAEAGPDVAGDEGTQREAEPSPAKAQPLACRAVRRANRPPAQAHVEVTPAAVTCSQPDDERPPDCSALRRREPRPVAREERLRKGIRRQRAGTVPVPDQPCVWQSP